MNPPNDSAAKAGAGGSAKLTRWRAVCAYVGTDLEGWQSQPSGNAVQDHVEKRLTDILGTPIRIHGSGRTDAGVHARGQVFHFDAAWKHGGEKLERALATGLPRAIQVSCLRAARSDFHARYSAKGKRYIYFLNRGRADPFDEPFCWSLGGRPLDVDAMRALAKQLCGKHDFRAFSAFGGEEREDTVREVRRLEIIGRGAKLRVVAEADGFLYKMVRSLVGALVTVGLGKRRPEEIVALLDGRARTNLVETAPAQGLFLSKVFY